MLEYVSGSAMRLPVVLQNSAGAPLSGVLVSSVTCSFVKSNGASYDAVLTSSDWVEFTGAAYLNQGYYNVVAAATYSSNPGIFQYCVRVSGANTYYGVVKLTAGDTTAIYFVLGTPASGSVSADISATYHAAAGLSATISSSVGNIDFSPVLKVIGKPVKTIAADIKETARGVNIVLSKL